MMIERKLIAGIMLSVLIGVATIVPLAFLMATKAQTPLLSVDQPQFNAEISYFYVGNYWDNNIATATREQNYGWLFSLVYETSPKFTLDSLSADGVAEYYTVDISSEKGYVGNVSFSTFLRGPNIKPFNFFFQNGQFFINSTNGAISSSGLGQNSNGTTIGNVNGPAKDWNGNLGKPDTLTLTVRRLGWVILKGNVTEIHQGGPEVVSQIQLQQFGDGFIYNKLFTQEELAGINPLRPQFQPSIYK
jgi:hypothetical protein